MLVHAENGTCMAGLPLQVHVQKQDQGPGHMDPGRNRHAQSSLGALPSCRLLGLGTQTTGILEQHERLSQVV